MRKKASLDLPVDQLVKLIIGLFFLFIGLYILIRFLFLH